MLPISSPCVQVPLGRRTALRNLLYAYKLDALTVGKRVRVVSSPP